MKRLAVLSIAAITGLSVQAQDISFKISGKAPAGDATVYLYDATNQREPLDSTKVTNGEFSFTRKGAKNAFFLVGGKKEYVAFINDGTPSLTADIATTTLKGSTLNEKFAGYQRATDVYSRQMHDMYTQYQALRSNKSVEAEKEMEAIGKKFETLQDSVMSLAIKVVKDNRDNVIPAFFMEDAAYAMTYDELKTALDPSLPYYDNALTTGAKRYFKSLEKRHPGLMYTDMTINDMDGKPRKLSEWIGKGNYVMIDFWASWCGPCRQEMPNVVENYKKYHAKGFEIIGISFDRKAEDWKASVKKMGMDWPQLSDLKYWQAEATKVYGIQSIPASILVDPTGKIVDIDLRGDKLGAKLKEIYEM